ncbi:hypothetical protein [Hydrogenovibrio sp. SC-1]|uniref:hypothetical protein n=1 Tax=Hydrogenovibrio sp. SC-1 TaxID=2065820 RepID=UPI001E2F86AE|nr:hypothetical protein [Hydrogenovibrio sp. SC-1]
MTRYVKSNLLLISAFSMFTLSVNASPDISGGVWLNYANNTTQGAKEINNGSIESEALVLYADGKFDQQLSGSYSFEWRMGPGSFTDKVNNSTNDNTTLHKGWIQFSLPDQKSLIVGKSQVPFGWKTSNFWPGDMYQAGYGDQMDVGFNLAASQPKYDYQLAYYHQDDWGRTSTDSTDDNGHWGSSSTYRKVQTFVGNLDYKLSSDQTMSLGLQRGKLQDFTNGTLSGSHFATVVGYQGQYDNSFAKAEIILANRTLPKNYAAQASTERDINTTRYAFELGRQQGNWTYYIDITAATTQTKGNSTGMITAYAPGLKYDYGPGWIYAEYLSQDGYFGRDGDIAKTDFSALYLTIDAYF